MAVLVACWAQPVVEQFTGDGEGNLSRLTSNAASDTRTVGFGYAARLVATVAAVPPFWGRSSFADAFDPVDPQPLASPMDTGRPPELVGLVGRGVAVVGLGLLAVVLAGAAWWARRRGRRDAVVAVLVGAAGLALSLGTAAALPLGPFGIGAHQVRGLWPVALVATWALGLALLPRSTKGVIAWAAAAVVLGALTLPEWNAREGPTADAYAAPVVERLASQLDGLDDEGTILFDVSSLRFAEPYSTPVMYALQRQGVDFVVEDEGMVRQLGDGREADGDEPARMYLRLGDAAAAPPSTGRRVALVPGLEPDERRELRRLEDTVVDLLGREGLELNERGREAEAFGRLPVFAGQPEGGPLDARRLLESRELAEMVEREYLAPPRRGADDLERYADLQARWDRRTVGVFLERRSERDGT
jgi:hypothetical protein